MRLHQHWRTEDGVRLPMALRYPGAGYRMISTSVLGGGLGLTAPGIGLLTAAHVTGLVQRRDGGAHVTGLVQRRDGGAHAAVQAGAVGCAAALNGRTK